MEEQKSDERKNVNVEAHVIAYLVCEFIIAVILALKRRTNVLVPHEPSQVADLEEDEYDFQCT